ncbi:VWA domain-containing protein [Abyssalbus ytuae]|uniref:VWA domain-containing protein n=1 Tax=Abyssalbus ytuae TaxID=2926907 RepID=A0A9E7CZH0_9FLAO|nr:VWA domain-containing protein [Abyssalbus ytuae]UOB17530.1 VWA domain-containing protein [Abyssalbus ytuae]
MPTKTIFFIILAAVISVLLSLFLYRINTSGSLKKKSVFIFLRFITIFSLLLLLINPQIKKVSYFVEKVNLSVVADNSSSIKFLNQQDNLNTIIDQIKKNERLNDKYNIIYYEFDNQLFNNDSLSFTGNQTNITRSLTSLQEINKGTTSPVILLTDGNQTYGDNYEYSLKNYNQPVFPVVLGDTVKHNDLKIQQLNVNRYSYLKNKFPVEVIVAYDGVGRVNTKFTISSGNNILYSKDLTFSSEENSKVLNIELPSASVGIKKYKAEIHPAGNEKNLVNNSRLFGVEVIDEKTDIAIISDILHPDLGAIRKSVESNEQRSVTFLKPNLPKTQINDYEILIIYQPNYKFKNTFETLKQLNKNFFIITGTKTDWRFLNNIQPYFDKGYSASTEEALPLLNTNFSGYVVEKEDFNNFPPLRDMLGETVFTAKNDVLLFKKIGNLETSQSLLSVVEEQGIRGALLEGEGLWRWRAQSFLDNKSFEPFDDFFGKLIQFLASRKKRERLVVDYESFYYGKSDVIISAGFFDKNYTFNPHASLQITLTNKNTGKVYGFPMLLKNNYYQVELNSLPAAEYEFTIAASAEKISKSGTFSILDFEVEKQFLNADVTKLQSLATNTKGEMFFTAKSRNLFNSLLNDERFKPVQKSKETIVPLIDWKWLLALIVLSLSAEWFLRKYNGLI